MLESKINHKLSIFPNISVNNLSYIIPDFLQYMPILKYLLNGFTFKYPFSMFALVNLPKYFMNFYSFIWRQHLFNQWPINRYLYGFHFYLYFNQCCNEHSIFAHVCEYKENC